jgi:hypothetical protein
MAYRSKHQEAEFPDIHARFAATAELAKELRCDRDRNGYTGCLGAWPCQEEGDAVSGGLRGTLPPRPRMGNGKGAIQIPCCRRLLITGHASTAESVLRHAPRKCLQPRKSRNSRHGVYAFDVQRKLVTGGTRPGIFLQHPEVSAWPWVDGRASGVGRGMNSTSLLERLARCVREIARYCAVGT